MSARDDAKLDRMLADGRASGPTLDRVWARLDASLDEAAHEEARVRAWRRPLAWLSGAAALSAAALALFVVVPNDDDFAPRGAQVGERLLASCGAVDDPCVVGEEIALALVGHQGARQLTLTLTDAEGTRPLLSSRLVEADERATLPLVLVADTADVARGLTITGATVRGMQNDDGRAEIPHPLPTLHLHVVSP